MPRAQLRPEQIERFRGRACRAATRLFAERGYRAVTMRAVATELGCSPMTPYRYFAGKDEIFALVKAAAYRRFADAQERASHTGHDAAERLHSLGLAYVEFALGEPDAYRIMFELQQDSASEQPELVREEARAWLPLRSAVAAAIESNLLAGDLDTVAHLLWAGLHGLVSLHLAGKLRLGRPLTDLVEPMLATLFVGNASGALRPAPRKAWAGGKQGDES